MSGYLISLSIINNIARNSHFSITDYAIARFCRIYPPLVLSVILVVVLHQFIIWLNLPGGTQPYGAPADLYQVRTFFSLTWRDVLGSLLLIKGLSIANGALWSLYFEVWCYAIAGYFTWSWYATNDKFRGLFLCFGLLITAAVCVYKPDFLMYALLWLVGFLCCIISKIKNTHKKPLIIILTLISSAFFSILSYRAFHLAIADLILLAFCFYLAFKWNSEYHSNLLIKVADFSYTLYIVHFPILLFSRSLSDSLGPQSTIANIMISLIVTSSILVFSWQMAQWVERPKFFQQKLRQLWP